MSKEELIQELANINSSFVNDINAKRSDLSDRFNEFTLKYDKVYSELQQRKSYNSHLLTRIIQLSTAQECQKYTFYLVLQQCYKH